MTHAERFANIIRAAFTEKKATRHSVELARKEAYKTLEADINHTMLNGDRNITLFSDGSFTIEYKTEDNKGYGIFEYTSVDELHDELHKEDPEGAAHAPTH